MKNYILHYINRRDNGLPFDKSGLLWTAQMNILPSIPGSCFREISTGKLNSHIETAQKEQLISTKGSPTRRLTQEIPVHRVLYRTRKDTVGQKIGEPLKTLKMDKKWSGWVQNVKLC